MKELLFSILLHGVLLTLGFLAQVARAPEQNVTFSTPMTAELYEPLRLNAVSLRGPIASASAAKQSSTKRNKNWIAESQKTLLAMRDRVDTTHPTDKPSQSVWIDNTTPTEYEQLNKLLNRRIKEHQFYPALAERLGQTGVAKMSFWLDKTGKISEIQMEASTAFEILNEAAQQAVRAIDPVAEAKNGLLHKEQFFVDVHFEL